MLPHTSNVDNSLQLDLIRRQLAGLNEESNLRWSDKFLNRKKFEENTCFENQMSITTNSIEHANELSKCKSDIAKINLDFAHITEQINLHQKKIQEQIFEIENELNLKIENSNAKIFNNLRHIKEELKIISEKDFVESFESIKTRMDALHNRCNGIGDAMATKADFDILHQKVSLDYFETTKRALTNSILELISQLAARENDWQRSLSDMNRLLESKLNKDEIPPLKDFLNKKVESIQDRLKSLNLLKRETEAAGTKYRLLKGVKCISCDSNAMMKVMETSPVPRKDSIMRKLPHKLFVNKLSEQMKTPKRAHTVSTRRSIILTEKRVKSSMELTMSKIKEN
jgi:F0F1-type ATP synthase membrane subunit b/b'